MPNFLTIRGYVFETQAVKDAYSALPPARRASTTRYSEAALRSLVRYFADWAPNRNDSLAESAEAELDALTPDEKRDLYSDFVRQLSTNLDKQYSRNVTADSFEEFAHTLAGDSLPPATLTFFLRYLWRFSQRVHGYVQAFSSDNHSPEESGVERTEQSPSSDGIPRAIHRLPSEYLDNKEAQYEGDDKINRVRYRALDTIRSSGSLSIATLKEYEQEENEKFETDIMVPYNEFTVLGQLYFDYFKPRINAYLKAITTYLIEELDITDSIAHHVNFSEPRNQLTDHTWFAIYPAEKGDKADAYQLFTVIHWDRVRYGLYLGDNLDEEEAGKIIDIDTITETDALTIDLLAEKFDAVLSEYHRLNGNESPESPVEPPEGLRTTIARQLENTNQVVFYGPPGTGKTFEAQRFANWWVHEGSDGKPKNEQVQSVTFHPSFSYEDFIEGLSAEATETGDVEYQVNDGILKRIASSAQTAYDRAVENDADPTSGPSTAGAAPPYVLIIDEINRGNLAQIFGETITLLEHDKRGSYEVSLAHSDDSFTLPPNLYVIGTMNTADRSIALVDAALRRRFRFVPFPPDYEALRVKHGFDSSAEVVEVATGSNDSFRMLLALSFIALERLNERIVEAPDLSKGQQIGHSYLWDVASVEELVDAWQYDLLPLLEEYYFGQFDRIRRQLFDGTGNELIDWEHERIRHFGDADLASFLTAFVDVDTESDYNPESTSGSSGTTSGANSPTFSVFLQEVGEQVIAETGEMLHAESLDDVHYNDDFERLTLAFESADPDHPEGEHARYRFLVRPHLDPPRIQAALSVSDDIRPQLAEGIEARLEESELPDELEYGDKEHSTIDYRFEVDTIDADPYAIDGDEVYEAFGEALVEDAIEGYVTLIETFHPLFVERDIELDEQ